MVQAGVRRNEPLAALARRKRKFIRNQIGAEVAANLRFLADLSAAAKRRHLLFGKQPHRLAVAERPRARRAPTPRPARCGR